MLTLQKLEFLLLFVFDQLPKNRNPGIKTSTYARSLDVLCITFHNNILKKTHSAQLLVQAHTSQTRIKYKYLINVHDHIYEDSLLDPKQSRQTLKIRYFKNRCNITS